jgi:hypothetical protein
VFRAANADGILQQGLQDALEVERRPADSLEHLGRGSLSPQRFAQFLRALLHLVEQTHVFDRDHRLVGEGRDQLDLIVGKWLHSVPPEHKRPEGRAIAQQQRHAQYGPDPSDLATFVPVVLGVLENVGNVDGAPFQDRPTGRRAAGRAMRMLPCKGHEFRIDIIGCSHAKEALIELPDEGAVRFAQMCGNRNDGVEGRLQLVRRPADEAEDFGDRIPVVERFPKLVLASLQVLLQRGRGWAAAADARLRSDRTKLAAVHSALGAFARQRSPRRQISRGRSSRRGSDVSIYD